MARYELTNAADANFESIFNFGIDLFGLDQALEYQNGMKLRFGELAEQPKLFAAIDHIATGYRRSVYKSHSICYRIEPGRVLIVRILGQQDTEQAMR